MKLMYRCHVIFSHLDSVDHLLYRKLLTKVTEVSNDPSKRTQELSSSATIKSRPKVLDSVLEAGPFTDDYIILYRP